MRWDEIESNADYQSKSDQEKAAIKSDFFETFIKVDPEYDLLPKDIRSDIKAQFIPEFSIGRLGSQIYRNAAQGLADQAQTMIAEERSKDFGKQEDMLKQTGLDTTLEQEKIEINDAIRNAAIAKGAPSNRSFAVQDYLSDQEISDLRVAVREGQSGEYIAKLKGFVEKMPEPLPGVPSGVGGVVEQAAGGVARFAPGMAISALNLPAGTMSTFSQIYGQKYGELTDSGIDHDTARESALMVAALNTPLEQAGTVIELGVFKKLLGKSGAGLTGRAKDFAKALLKSATTEGFEEFLQQYPDEIANIYASNPEMSAGELVQEVSDQIPSITKGAFQAAEIGAVGGLMMAGGVQAVSAPSAIRQEISDKIRSEQATKEVTKEQVLKSMEDDLSSGVLDEESISKLAPNLQETYGIGQPEIDEVVGRFRQANIPSEFKDKIAVAKEQAATDTALFEPQTEAEQAAIEREIIAQRGKSGLKNRIAEAAKARQKEISGKESDYEKSLAEFRNELRQRVSGEIKAREVDKTQQGREILRKQGIELKTEIPTTKALPPGQGFELRGKPYTPGMLPATAMRMPGPQEIENAEKIRKDEGPVQERGIERQGGETEGRKDLQQPEKEGTEASYEKEALKNELQKTEVSKGEIPKAEMVQEVPPTEIQAVKKEKPINVIPPSGKERRSKVVSPGEEAIFVERRTEERKGQDRRKYATTEQIPEFKNTNEAVEFGEKATPEQISKLNNLWEQTQKKEAELKAAKDFSDKRTNNAFMGQLYREALEASRGEHPSQTDRRTPAKMIADQQESETIVGSAWVNGQRKPFIAPREIIMGKNKGKYEIRLTRGKDESGNIRPGLRKIINKSDIVSMPSEKQAVKTESVNEAINRVKSAIKSERGSWSFEKEDHPITKDLITIGRHIYSNGATKYSDFVKNLKASIGDAYNSIKNAVRKLYRSVRQIVSNERGEITAWHGSPHKFEKFTTDKIGSGEGSQAFGWGLYFTDNRDIAQYYSDVLGGSQRMNIERPDYIINGREFRAQPYDNPYSLDFENPISPEEFAAIEAMVKFKNDKNKAKEWLINKEVNQPTSKNASNLIDDIDPQKYNFLYETTLFPGRTDETWIDWYKKTDSDIINKISKYFERKGQSDLAQRFTKSVSENNLSGHQLYRELSEFYGSDKEASLFLKRAGIDGIRYPAGTLSGGGRGTNYVVFDENAVLGKSINDEKIHSTLTNNVGSSQLATDIINYGINLKNRSVKNFTEFCKSMRKKFAGIWDKIKSSMLQLWKSLKAVTFNERGSISFEETRGNVTEKDYEKNRKTSSGLKIKSTTGIARVISDIAEGTDKYLGAISTRLGNINPKLKHKLRKLDFDIGTKSSEDSKGVIPLLKKAKKKMTNKDFIDWDYARKNSDTDKIWFLAEKYGLREDYKKYRETLDRLRKEGIDVGLDIGLIPEYAPRVLKDKKGFLRTLHGQKDWDIYSRALRDKAQLLGLASVSELSDDQKADIISNMIAGQISGLGGVSATKSRRIQKIPPELNKFYLDSDSALINHIYSMRKAIELRKFFGKVPQKVSGMKTRLRNVQRKQQEIKSNLAGKLSKAQKKALARYESTIKKRRLMKKEKDVLRKRIDKLKTIQQDTLPNKIIKELEKKKNRYIGLEKEYTAYIGKYADQRDFRENIGAYVLGLITSGEIKPDQEKTVHDILVARFHEVGTHGLVQMYKNFSYIDTMGSPISALTQIGDLAWSMYDGGVLRTGKNAIKSLVGKSKIKKEDIGIDRIAQEFVDPGTLGRAVEKVFKYTQLERMDKIGKEALMNSVLEKYQKMARKRGGALKAKLKPIFENETNALIKDLARGEITDNVKLLVYNRLLDFQPLSLSEMPQKYLDAGNGRIFYMLKTFTLKQFDVYRNEVYNEIKNGKGLEKIKGLRNLIRLSMFFVIANASADEIKDFFLKRKTTMEDRVVDNILRLFGVSKFITWQARREGIGTAMLKQILPPAQFIDSVYKDIVTDEETPRIIKSIPVVGKIAYWHMKAAEEE